MRVEAGMPAAFSTSRKRCTELLLGRSYVESATGFHCAQQSSHSRHNAAHLVLCLGFRV